MFECEAIIQLYVQVVHCYRFAITMNAMLYPMNLTGGDGALGCKSHSTVLASSIDPTHPHNVFISDALISEISESCR